MDRNHEVKKGEAGGGDFVGEFDGWVERGNKVYETKEFIFGTGSDAKAVVYEPAVENWERAGVLLEDLFLQQADEEAGVAGSHVGAHSYATGLHKMIIVELKGVESEYQLSQADKSGDRQGPLIFVEVVLEGQKTVRMGDAGVQRCNIHGEQEVVGGVRWKGEVLQDLKSVVGVFEIGWK